MSLPDGAEYWWGVKNRQPYMGPDYKHHPTYTCSHYNPKSGNISRTPYSDDINCEECKKVFQEGNINGIVSNVAPPTFYMSKREKKQYYKDLHFEEKHGKCSCGGNWTIRRNSKTHEEFLGCLRYPKCRNTKKLNH